MTHRAKCPSCGRRQPAELSQAGRGVFCAACGARFVVEITEQNGGEATIPDIDSFPTGLSSSVAPNNSSSAPTSIPPNNVAAASSAMAAAPLATAAVAPIPHPLPGWPSAAVAPPPRSDPSPQMFSPTALRPSWIVPMVIAGVVIVGLTLALGVTLGYLISRPQRKTGLTAPVVVMPTATTRPVHAIQSMIISRPIPPSEVSDRISRAPAPALAAMERDSVLTELAPLLPPPAPLAPKKFQPVRPAVTSEDLDDQIGKSIERGVDYLLSQFTNGRLKQYNPNNPMTAGLDALAVYALLHAGEATHDLRLGPNMPLVGQMLDALKRMPMDRAYSTYSRSLRAAALGVYHRIDDKNALRDDCAWLIADSRYGEYSYQPRPGIPGRREFDRDEGGWDNSNSQYGALGVWAALEAGVEVPHSYWQAVQKHWLSCQLPDGEWGYTGYGAMGRLSMTVAGITTLLVTEDQLDARDVIVTLGHQPFTPALARGLAWLETGNNAVRLPQGGWRTYNLFGLERAALASGFKYFGDHDWYRELAIEQLAEQQPDGSWTESEPIVDTSYTLLFLSRGRHPIFMNKLRFDGYWANRPRDIANLAHYASDVLERPLNWQVVSFKSDWSDWMDSPILFIASHEALKFSDDDVNKLRWFAENGGLIFTHADGDSEIFSKSIAELAKRLFPQYPLTDLPATHPIFSSLYRIKQQPRMQGISNGSRLLLVHSMTDLNKYWQLRDPVEKLTNFQMGINIFIYAAGKADLRNRLKTPVVPEPKVTPILATTIAQLRHQGDWDPEPAGLPRFARLFLGQTSVKVNVIETDAQTLNSQEMPLVHLTGTGPVHFNTGELKAIHDYVDGGGTLLIDACGGSSEFLKSMVGDVLPHAFPRSLLADIQGDNPILAGSGAGMTPVTLKLRPWREEVDGTTTQPLQYLTQGKGMVIFSTVDLSTGLLGTNTWPVNGYQPDTAYDLVRNVLLEILER